MEKLMTKSDINQVNYNDISFLLSKNSKEAKLLMLPEKDKKDFLRNKVKVKLKDTVPVDSIRSLIKSPSQYEGADMIDVVINQFNKGVPVSTLRELACMESFIKAIAFTGRYAILNKILNREQYLLLQKKWLLSNVINKHNYTKKSIEFILKNPWSYNYLIENNIDVDNLNRNIEF